MGCRRTTQGFGGMAKQSPTQKLDTKNSRGINERFIAPGWSQPTMATNPQAPPLSSWDVYRHAHKAIWLGTVEATDERDAIEKVAKERNIPANWLIATRRR
jgi:hypothetical protein